MKTLLCSALLLTLLFSLVCAMPRTRPSVETCGTDLPRGSDAGSLQQPTSTVAEGHYIAMTAPVSCSGLLTGYFYYYLGDENSGEGTISMWRHIPGQGLEMIPGSINAVVQSSSESTGRSTKSGSGSKRRRKRMGVKRQYNEVQLSNPIPVTRDSMPAIQLNNNDGTKGYFFADSSEHTLCHLTSSAFSQTLSSCSNSSNILLVQPLINSVNCQSLDNILNGELSYSHQPQEYGDTATYVCNTGYVLSGGSLRTCQSDGSWSGSAPLCVKASTSVRIPSSSTVMNTDTMTVMLSQQPLETTTSPQMVTRIQTRKTSFVAIAITDEPNIIVNNYSPRPDVSPTTTTVLSKVYNTPMFSSSAGKLSPKNGSDIKIPVLISTLFVLLLVGACSAAIVFVVLFIRAKRRKTKPFTDDKKGITNPAIYSSLLYEESVNLPINSSGVYEVSYSEYCVIGDNENSSLIGTYHEVDSRNDERIMPYSSIELSSSPISSNINEMHYELPKSKEDETCCLYERPANQENDIYMQLDKIRVKQINEDALKITGHLGSGQFGSVEKAVWMKKGGKTMVVAVKALKPGASKEEKVKFLQEAAIMGQFKHPNVVCLCGMTPNKEKPLLVIELMSGGDLHVYLNQMRTNTAICASAQTPKKLIRFCQHICQGMKYLSGKGFVHRDLAARNILVSSDGVCKVADYGMSRDLDEENYYIAATGGKIPIKWTAPEAVYYRKYSTASDVWSYGCLLYEIWSLGRKPFESYSNQQALRMIESGFRLAPPPGCPRMMYELMIRCWHPDAHKRVSFNDIVPMFKYPSNLIRVPKDAISSHPQAEELGAPLEAGAYMYTKLQTTYKH